jgi:UDP-N-acetylmuramoyl-tripeptide--D-alanyl-D-alanine ligase
MEIRDRPDGVTVINDAYNANPDSMRAAVEALMAMARGRGTGVRTWAVLGEMRELGAGSHREHEAVGRLVARSQVSRLVVVGDRANPLHQGACLEAGWQGESVLVPDVEQAVRLVCSQLRAGDIVLVKASRASGLEQVAQRLVADSAAVGAVPNPPAEEHEP